MMEADVYDTFSLNGKMCALESNAMQPISLALWYGALYMS